MCFMIRMTKSVIVRDCEGNVTCEYKVGDILEASADAGHYWVAGPGIYKDEAVRLDDPIDERFIQLGEN